MNRPFLFASAALFSICLLCRSQIERHMATHVLILLPALVASGWFAGQEIARRWEALRRSDWNLGGATGLLVALLASAFWMLPRSLDWSLGETGGELAKFVMLPVFVGVPLALSWPRAALLVRSFAKANAVSMALILGWLYSVAPVRLCNSYGAGEQELLGLVFLWLAGLLGIVWTAPVLGIRLTTWRLPSIPSIATGERR
jgi:hypothetical protein